MNIYGCLLGVCINNMMETIFCYFRSSDNLSVLERTWDTGTPLGNALSSTLRGMDISQ